MKFRGVFRILSNIHGEAFSTVNFFLTSICLSHGQLRTIIERTASLTRCYSLRFLQFRPEGQREPRNEAGSLGPAERLVWFENREPFDSDCNALTHQALQRNSTIDIFQGPCYTSETTGLTIWSKLNKCTTTPSLI